MTMVSNRRSLAMVVLPRHGGRFDGSLVIDGRRLDIDRGRVSVAVAGGDRSTGRPRCNPRRVLDGILWVLRTGSPWRDLPEKYGKWMTVYQRFRRWSEAGIWEAVATTLAQAMADNSRHSLDSTTVRGHVSAAGAKGGLANRLLAARGAGSPVKFIVSVMPEGSRSSSISHPAKPRTARRSKM